MRRLINDKTKGFTLIELLAVITIMGILLIIAIPAVNKIIFESRKRTYVNTAKSYIADAANYVKEMEGEYYDPDATYYIDTYCLNLDDNASSPFSKFVESYVVVGFDDIKGKYNYSWFSYDKTGYGVDLIERDKLKKSDVEGGIKKLYKRPLPAKNGNLYLVNKQNGCVQEEFDYEVELPESDLPVLMEMKNGFAFWKYKQKIKNIIFENSINVPDNAVESWDVSSTGNGKVMAYIKNNDISGYYDLYIQGDGKIYAPSNSSRLFEYFDYVDNIFNIDYFNTSRVTNMSRMFFYTGVNSLVFKLDLGSNFNTSNVTNMSSMFYWTGKSSPVFTLNLGNKFDTSNVTNMSSMFDSIGQDSLNFILDLGTKFDTSNVTKMDSMFRFAGFESSVFTINFGNKFDTSKVTSMRFMFSYTGARSPIFNLKLPNEFTTSSVTDMTGMFSSLGYLSPGITLDLGDKFDTSNVTNMSQMFLSIGANNNNFVLDLRDKFDTSNVVNMSQMFKNAGMYSRNFSLELGDKFDTSNVTDMTEMFAYMAMDDYGFTLNCRSWDVSRVTRYTKFNYASAYGLTPPIWVN